MATAAQTPTDTGGKPQYGIGVIAGLEYSPVKNAKLNDEQIAALKELHKKAVKRDYPARLIEIIQAWEAALFYRGFQFLIPNTSGGGWIIPGESTGYGPSMQMDLALLPTNIYSARAQMIIAALTRTVPSVRFGPENAMDDAQITTAESADKFLKVIYRNVDPIMVQTDASRYLWTDGRFIYWSRFEKNGQKFGWEEDDEPANIVPENEPPDEQGTTPVEATAGEQTPESEETAEEPGAEGQAETAVELPQLEETPTEEAAEPEEKPKALTKRTPRGQEVRTAHGKLETKIVPMMANELEDADAIMFAWEVDKSRAKGMFPWIADKIKAGGMGLDEDSIARLARQNVKLGMQSTYITSSSVAEDITISRDWFRPSALMDLSDEHRDEMIAMFPNGCYVVWAGDQFAFARNESMDDSLALGQAYSGDGQNRNAMGTSTMPLQKRLNNWLDLINDFFVRCIPKIVLDNRAFDVPAIRNQSNIPGDTIPFKRVAGVPVDQLAWVMPTPNPQTALPDFIKEYSGPLSELLSGAYPALAGGDVGTADSGVAIATQRDSALGRLAPTWHSIKNCEATSSKQLVRWGGKCRDKSINEQIPGGEVIKLEVNDLKGNIHCFAESDENFPETYTQKKNNFMQVFDAALKNPQVGEIFFNGANLEFLQDMSALKELYIPQVASHKKQLGEIELMKSGPVPNPAYIPPDVEQMMAQKISALQQAGVDPQELDQAIQQLQAGAQAPPEICSVPIDAEVDDNPTEAASSWMWLNSEDGGRKAKHNNPKWFENVRMHFLDHKQAADAAAAAAGGQAKPPSMSIGWKDVAQLDKGAADQMLQKGGIMPTPGAAPQPVPTGQGEKGPAAPLPTGAAESAGGKPKL